MNSTKNLFAPVQQMFATLAIFALVLGTFATAPFVFAAAPVKTTIDICHATNSNSKPYNSANADDTADAGGHAGHTGPVWFSGIPKGTDWGDIIPPFHYPAKGADPEGDFAGLNWDAAGQAIWNSGLCDGFVPTVGTITINKTLVKNDNNGPETVDSFTYKIDGNAVSEGVAIEVLAGPHTVSEDAFTGYTPSAWTGTGCAGGLVDVVAGQDYTCNITNDDNAPVVNPGTIIVNKVTVPAEDAQSFTFVTTGTGYNGFALTDTDAPNSQQLAAGAYTVSEDAVTGWTQTSAICVSSIEDIETPGALELDQNETITCTFTNTRDTGSLTILKDTADVLGDLVEFDFSGTGAIGSFNVLGDSTDFEEFTSLPTGSYTVTELDAADWSFGSVVCTEEGTEVYGNYDAGDSNVVVDVQKGDNITCTFTNTKDAGPDDTTVTVIKQTIPDADTTDFNFFFGAAEVPFATLSDGESSGAQVVEPGSFVINEGAVDGWTLTDAVCLNESQVEVGSLDGGMYLTLAAGDDVTCTFTNTKRPADPEALSCDAFTSNDYTVAKNQEFTLSWNTSNADFVEISGIDGLLLGDDSLVTSVTSDTTFTLTASRQNGEDVETKTCEVAIDVRSSGGGSSSGSRRTPPGEVLGEVLGEATSTLPVGAPNTGAGNTSPITVSLPSLVAVLGTRTRIVK